MARPRPRRRCSGDHCACHDGHSRSPGAAPVPAAAAGRGRGAALDDGDFTTVQRYDNKVPPSVTADDAFFEFLFSGSEVNYATLKEKAAAQEPLPPFALKGVKITFNVDAEYTVVRTRLTHNVVGVVEGTRSEAEGHLRRVRRALRSHRISRGRSRGWPRRPGAGKSGGSHQQRRRRRWLGDRRDHVDRASVRARAEAEAIGALRLARRRGNGLLGSRYNADFPVVPIDKIVAQLNMDMVGRNKDNDPQQANTVLVVGSDRISTELHNINEDANARCPSR